VLKAPDIFAMVVEVCWPPFLACSVTEVNHEKYLEKMPSSQMMEQIELEGFDPS
jgi:hypothetical protein